MNSTIACPTCGQTNAAGSLFCAKCHTSFPGAGDSPTIGAAFAIALLVRRYDARRRHARSDHGTRHKTGRWPLRKFWKSSGQGAMGAVYKAKDHELDRWSRLRSFSQSWPIHERS